MIFKGNVAQAHGRVGTFVPGFGVTIAEAVGRTPRGGGS